MELPMAEPFLGQITVYPYPFPPYGWMDCAGQLLPISQYAALFSLLGTNYGGNGTTNFGLPDLQGRVPVGQGTAVTGTTYLMGETDGAENVTVLTAEMPAHTHGLVATTVAGTTNTPTGNILAMPQTVTQSGTPRAPIVATESGNLYVAAAPDTTLAPTSVGPAGGSQPHNNIQPSLTLRYCICLSGAFPVRS
jgi:microcystin-dependent protein